MEKTPLQCRRWFVIYFRRRGADLAKRKVGHTTVVSTHHGTFPIATV